MAGQRRRARRHRRAVAPLLAACLTLTACQGGSDELATVGSESTPTSQGQRPDGGKGPGMDPTMDPTMDPSPTPTTAPEQGTGDRHGTSYAVEPPGPFDRLSRPDVLITATESLPDALVERVRTVTGVQDALPLSVGSASVDGRTLMVAAVDPGKFRRFTPDVTARADFVWRRVAGGEVAVDPDVDKRLISRDEMIRLGSDPNAPEVHVGAIAPLVKRSVGTVAERPVIQAIVNVKRGRQIGMQEQNAILVDTGQYTPSFLAEEFEEILGDTATMQVLALEFDEFGQSAVLTGTSVSEAVGTFTYTNGPEGTIVPDREWVAEYIRTEPVPILGSVTCNKAYLPQLRAALSQVVREGLEAEIHPEEYAGCYYPRYIGRDPANGLSLHSWGIAVDLNVPGNLRGTKGEIDRRVVEIFKQWGMAWGGDWSYTDPMHFEMAEVVRPQ